MLIVLEIKTKLVWTVTVKLQKNQSSYFNASDSPEILLLQSGLVQSTSYLFTICVFIAKQISFNVSASVPLLCYREKRTWGFGLTEINPNTHTSSQTLSQADSGLQGDDDTEGEKQNINI